jgi:uncharacterized protein (DUF1499 family)
MLLSISLMSKPIGLNKGNFTPCNNRWNCALTQRVNGQQPSLDPIYYTGSRKNAIDLLKDVLAQFERVNLILESDNYLHVTVTSKVWKFIDDVEFYFPEGENVIHMRSASRVGKHDLGVNKRRLKKIRRLFYTMQSR